MLSLSLSLLDLKKDNISSLLLYLAGPDIKTLWMLNNDLRNNKDVAIAVVCRIEWALRYAPGLLKDDIEIVLAAVNQHGRALQYASDTIKR